MKNYLSQRIIKLLTNRCIANEIGPATCWLITIIANEMKIKERETVTYSNQQLMERVGIKTARALRSTRQKAIDAGWLDYAPGGKFDNGMYSVKVPKVFTRVNDNTDTQDPYQNEDVKNLKGALATPASAPASAPPGGARAHQLAHPLAPSTHKKKEERPALPSSDSVPEKKWLELKFFDGTEPEQHDKPPTCPVRHFNASTDSKGRYAQTVYWVSGTGWQGITARYRDALELAFPEVNIDFHLEKMARWLEQRRRQGRSFTRFNFHGLICYWLGSENRFPNQPGKQIIERQARQLARQIGRAG